MITSWSASPNQGLEAASFSLGEELIKPLVGGLRAVDTMKGLSPHSSASSLSFFFFFNRQRFHLRPVWRRPPASRNICCSHVLKVALCKMQLIIFDDSLTFCWAQPCLRGVHRARITATSWLTACGSISLETRQHTGRHLRSNPPNSSNEQDNSALMPASTRRSASSHGCLKGLSWHSRRINVNIR